MEFSETFLDGIDDDPTPGDIRRWVGQAKAEGAAAERARIRGELLEWLEGNPTPYLDNAIDRICPEAPRECAAFIAGDPSTCPRDNCDDCPEEG